MTCWETEDPETPWIIIKEGFSLFPPSILPMDGGEWLWVALLKASCRPIVLLTLIPLSNTQRKRYTVDLLASFWCAGCSDFQTEEGGQGVFVCVNQGRPGEVCVLFSMALWASREGEMKDLTLPLSAKSSYLSLSGRPVGMVTWRVWV